jgi:hypothetical protein
VSEIEIRSDGSTFEEKDFILSLAQRWLAKTIAENYGGANDWINDYAEDVYYSSWNDSFKSFFLESCDGYFCIDKSERIDFLKKIISSAVIRLSDASADEFFHMVVEPIYLDEVSGLGSQERVRDHFLPHVPLSDFDSRKILYRVKDVLERIIGIL